MGLLRRDGLVSHLSSVGDVVAYRCSRCGLVYTIPPPHEPIKPEKEIPEYIIQLHANHDCITRGLWRQLKSLLKRDSNS